MQFLVFLFFKLCFQFFPFWVIYCSWEDEVSRVPSGELTFCHGKSPFFMGKSTISMALFNSFLYVHQRVALLNWAKAPTLIEEVQGIPQGI